MAEYDGSIRIKTQIDSKNASVQLATLENRISKTADKIAGLRSKMDALKDAKIPTQEYQDLESRISNAEKAMDKMLSQDTKLSDVNEKIKSLSQSSANYAEKMKAIANTQIPTQEYSQIAAQIEKAEHEFDKLLAKQEQMQNEGKDNGVAWKRINNQIDEAGNTIRYAKGELQDLVDTGKAFVLGADTNQYKDLAAKYESVNRELEKQKAIHSEIAQKQAESVQKTIELKAQMQQLVKEGKAFTLGSDTQEYSGLSRQLKYAEKDLSVLNQKHEVLILKQKQTADGYKNLGETAKKSLEKINKSQKKSIGFFDTFGKRLSSILSSVFIFEAIRRALTSMINGVKEGFSNLYEENARFKNSVDSLKASMSTLKNSLAAAFSPIVEIAIPYIQRFIDWIAEAISYVGQFIAALTGRKTYTKAVKQTASASKKAAAATKDETEAIEDQTDAVNKQLSPLDKLNNLTSDKSKNDINDKGAEEDLGTGGAGAMFEEVPIDSKIMDFVSKLRDMLKPLIDYAQKLKDIFAQGFWDGLGDWQYRWESIKDSIASIKESLIDIFTDPAVLAAVDKWAQSVAYMLGSLVGSLASVGLTIADNILGGIAKYLEQNKDRIKNYLISMFDIWEEVNYMFADLFQSIAYVFEAFATEQGQQLTANIIGIFSDAFMGITELASKFFRDIANLIIQPFVDNKETLRTALEGFLSVLSEVTGTIKQGIDDTFDKLNEVYDQHFKPFFDSVSQGLSDLLAKFLEFWNGNVQPILEQWAADFDELWTSHIQPLLDNAAEFLGKIADLLKVLWETIIQPLIEWIIQNVLPKLLPVIQAVWDALKNLFGYIADIVSSAITILGGLIDFITGVFSGDWEKAFQGLQDIVSGFIDAIKNIIEGGVQLLLDIITTFIEAAKSEIDLVLQAIQKTIEICINWIKTNIVGKFNEIKSGFSTFKSNISNIWTQTWQGLYNKVTELIGKIKSKVTGAFDWITQKMKGISSGIGSIGSKVGGMFKGISAPTGVQIPVSPVVAALSDVEIPAYATGQVIPRTMKQHLAVLGDNTRETEVVSPLSTIEQAVTSAMAKAGFAGGQDINLNLKVECEGYQLLNIMQKLDRQFYKQNGRHAFS